MSITIEVLGIAKPGGSKVAGITRDGKGFVRDDNPDTGVWKSDVRKAAAQQYKGCLLHGPITMVYEFRFPRPKRHYRTGKNSDQLRADAETWHVVKPDLTKIIRSTEDALTGIVWQDDSQVCNRFETKRYCNPGEVPGVKMVIKEL